MSTTRTADERRGNLAKMITILSREYSSRVKTKGFILSTVLLPVLMLAMITLPVLLAGKTSDEAERIAVVDLSNEVYKGLHAILDTPDDKGNRQYLLVEMKATPENLESVKALLTEQLGDNVFDAFLILHADILDSNRAEIFRQGSRSLRDRELRSAISRAVVDRRLLRSGLEPESVRSLVANVQLTYKQVTASGEEKEDRGELIAVGWGMVFFLYMTIIIYGNIIMRSVLEEKTSRVVESVISSVKPFYLMAGKVIGVGAVGLTQFLIWTLAALLISLYGAGVIGMLGGGADGSWIPGIPLELLIFFVIFFVLGYFLYATLYAGVGAIVNADQEAQQMAMPLVLFLVVPMILMSYVLTNPDSQTSVILSLIPFFSPMIMLIRIAVLPPPALQIAAALLLLVLTFLFNVWIVGKVFRIGVLMYGKRPTLPEIFKWIRYA